MFWTRRKNPLFQLATKRIDHRRARSLGQGALLGLAAITLAACEPQGVDTQTENAIASAEVFPAASLGPFDGHINAITFTPVATVPWEGRLVIAPGAGGLKVIDVEGQEDSTWAGTAITGLAARPGFDLRGLGTSIVLALKADGGLLSFIVDDARGQIIELPVTGLPQSGVTALCALETGTDNPSFLIGKTDKTLAIWTIADAGEVALSANKKQTGTLAIILSHCTSVGTEIFGTGDKGGLFKLALGNDISMLLGVESPMGKTVAIPTKGQDIVLISDPAAGNIHVYNANLLPLYDLKTPKALSTPGAAAPGALAVSAYSFGGAGFSAGLMAVADDSTNRIALVVLDTIPVKAETTTP